MPDADRQPYVEDALDDDDNPIDGSKSYNSSAAPSIKEEANVSRTRNRDNLRSGGSASPTKDLQDDSESDSAARRSPVKRESKRSKQAKSKDQEREREKAKAKRKSVAYEQPPRPHSERAKTTPILNVQTGSSTTRRQLEPAASPIITAGGTTSRPRAYTAHSAPRPASYYGSPGSVPRPPLSNTRYYVSGQPALGTSFPPPQPPYPPQSPVFFPPTAPPYTGQYPIGQAFSPAQGFGHPPADYFSQGPPRAQALRHEYRRPRSAMGNHPAHAYDREYDNNLEDGGGLVRAPSVKKRPSVRQQEEERKLMPPPRIRRPSTSAAPHSPFAPPRRKQPSVSSIRSMDFLDNDSVDDESQYSPSEQSRFDWRPHSVRRPNVDPGAYDHELRHERSPERRRPNSYYGARPRSTERDYEDKFQHAQRYQEKLDGPTNQLTVETLRGIARTPSQQTSSRGNESYALTNRNSVDTEDMRILIRGGATLTIGDASMAVQDGAEIRIPTNVSGGDRTSRGGGSNDSDTAYDDRRLEDRRTRVDRPQTRVGRATSRTGSHSRGLPAPGGYYPPPPPTEYSGHGGHYGHAQQVPAMYAPHSGYQYPM